MNFYLTLTTKCNLQCRYCYGKSCEDFGSDFHDLAIDYSVPSTLSYDTDVLRKFLEGEQDVALIFYGGEPLLKLSKISEIMRILPTARFVIQTNGLMLDKIGEADLNRFESIFVSLDGNEKITDYYRGRGTYRKVAQNIRKIREDGFQGEIVARMTVGEATDIDEQVMSLIRSELPLSSIHWQLDALFWQNDYPKRRFKEWATNSYNPRLRKLIHIWLEQMRSSGEVWRLYPFVGVTDTMLTGESNNLRCGAGWTLFNIQTDGNITPCPVMAGMSDFYLGNIHRTSPRTLKDSVFVKEPCASCEILPICGGRCLYANVTRLWGAEGYKEVCGTVINMVEELRNVRPEIEDLIGNGVVRREDFAYPKYVGCEIIP